MPTPSPAPTEAELVEAAEIMAVSYDDAAALVSADSVQAVSDAKWAKALEYIEAWPKVRDASNKIKRVGSIEFFEGRAGIVRLDFRNKLRALYGLDLLSSELYGVQPAFTSLTWF